MPRLAWPTVTVVSYVFEIVYTVRAQVAVRFVVHFAAIVLCDERY